MTTRLLSENLPVGGWGWPQVVNWPEVWIVWTALTPPWITPSLVLFCFVLFKLPFYWRVTYVFGLQNFSRAPGLGNPQVWLLLTRDKGHLWGRTVTEPSVSSRYVEVGTAALLLFIWATTRDLPLLFCVADALGLDCDGNGRGEVWGGVGRWWFVLRLPILWRVSMSGSCCTAGVEQSVFLCSTWP